MFKLFSEAFWTGKSVLFVCSLVAICSVGYGFLLRSALLGIFNSEDFKGVLDGFEGGGPINIFFLGLFGLMLGQFFCFRAVSVLDDARTPTLHLEVLGRLIAWLLIAFGLTFIVCRIFRVFTNNLWIVIGVGAFTHYVVSSVSGAAIFELIKAPIKEDDSLQGRGTGVTKDIGTPSDVGLPPRPKIN